MRIRPVVGILMGCLALPSLAPGQYAEIPRPLPAPVIDLGTSASPGAFTSAVQIGRRLFVAGSFSRLARPVGSAVVANAAGAVLPGAFPQFGGTVHAIQRDNAGGWLVAGEFTSVDGQPRAGFVRVAPDRTVDDRYRVVADGPIRKVALAHGRIYLVGDFTSLNGATRRGLAALDAATGALSSWGAAFDPNGGLRELSFSSLAVYLVGGGGRGHLGVSTRPRAGSSSPASCPSRRSPHRRRGSMSARSDTSARCGPWIRSRGRTPTGARVSRSSTSPPPSDGTRRR